MKTAITLLTEFLEGHGLSIVSIHLKLLSDGQVEYCTGTFKTSLVKVSSEWVTQEYKDNLSSKVKEFTNTEIEITLDSKFIIINHAYH